VNTNRRRRRVKRCRRGKSSGGSPSINFKCKAFGIMQLALKTNHTLARDKTSVWVYAMYGLLLLCLLLLFFSLNHNSFETSGTCCLCVCRCSAITECSDPFTKKAKDKIAYLINPCKEKGPITLRDVSRFIDKHEKLISAHEIIKSENKKLIAQCKRLNDKNKSLHQSQIKNEQPLTLLKQGKNYGQSNLEIEAGLTNTQFNNGKIGNIESSKLVKVWLSSNCSFRSFARVVNGLSKQHLYRGSYCPSPNTLINWCIRAGTAKLNGVRKYDEPCIDIIDHWIGKGDCKIFAVLRISISKYKKRNKDLGALNLGDFELVHLEIMRKSNGEKVSSSLEKLYKKIGNPVAIISDSGSDLKKGLSLLNEKLPESNKIYRIKDISHKLACIFKKEYEDLDWFKDFFTILSNGNKKLQNGMHANLVSPAQNTKARFMNIGKQVEWYINKIDNIQRGNLTKEEGAKFDEVYSDLKKYESKIISLHETIDLSHRIMAVLKVQGLNVVTRKECIKIIFSNQGNGKIKKEIIQWINDHQEINKKLSNMDWSASMPITSDPIESFFSKYKILQKRTPQGDPTRIIAILPLLVGNNSAEEIHNLISTVSHKEALKWVKENVPETIHSKKRKLGTANKEKKRTKSGKLNDQRKRPYHRANAA